jgi:mgtE-like transporter
MRRLLRRVGARVRALLGQDARSAWQAFVALVVSSVAGLVAGVALGAITHTLEALPGLLVLVPAAIGMRGNIFGALGSRLGTSIHAGTFRVSRRADTLVGQNILASIVLTLSISLALAVLAKAVAVGFGLPDTISVVDFVVISVVGGVLSSAVVLPITLAIAAGAARYDWDLDSVAAPMVTAAGDLVTLPSLFLATYLVGIGMVTPVLAAVLTAASVVVVIAAARSGLPVLRRVLRESVPVLLVAALVDVLAGLTIEKRLESFTAFPALLVLVPPYLENLGGLGGILSSRLSSKLHLGMIEPRTWPQRAARGDALLIVAFAVPAFVLVAVFAEVAAHLTGLGSPGLLTLVAVTMLGGMLATLFAVAVAYFSAIATFRLGLDPDNHGIPLVTSSMDMLGAFSLIMAIVVVGVGS